MSCGWGGAGLLGNNWLYLLDMAKKNVLQPNATIIPAAATLYCMGIEARTSDVCGFDFSSFNKYRWEPTVLHACPRQGFQSLRHGTHMKEAFAKSSNSHFENMRVRKSDTSISGGPRQGYDKVLKHALCQGEGSCP